MPSSLIFFCNLISAQSSLITLIAFTLSVGGTARANVTLTPTMSPSPSASISPTYTPSHTPSATPSPSPTPIATASPSPSPTGPFDSARFLSTGATIIEFSTIPLNITVVNDGTTTWTQEGGYRLSLIDQNGFFSLDPQTRIVESDVPPGDQHRFPFELTAEAAIFNYPAYMILQMEKDPNIGFGPQTQYPISVLYDHPQSPTPSPTLSPSPSMTHTPSPTPSPSTTPFPTRTAGPCPTDLQPALQPSISSQSVELYVGGEFGVSWYCPDGGYPCLGCDPAYVRITEGPGDADIYYPYDEFYGDDGVRFRADSIGTRLITINSYHAYQSSLTIVDLDFTVVASPSPTPSPTASPSPTGPFDSATLGSGNLTAVLGETTYSVINVTNDGTTTWTQESGYTATIFRPYDYVDFLHAYDPFDFVEAVGPGEDFPLLMELYGQDVPPGGTTSLQIQMKKEPGLGYFGPRMEAEIQVYATPPTPSPTPSPTPGTIRQYLLGETPSSQTMDQNLDGIVDIADYLMSLR